MNVIYYNKEIVKSQTHTTVNLFFFINCHFDQVSFRSSIVSIKCHSIKVSFRKSFIWSTVVIPVHYFFIEKVYCTQQFLGRKGKNNLFENYLKKLTWPAYNLIRRNKTNAYNNLCNFVLRHCTYLNRVLGYCCYIIIKIFLANFLGSSIALVKLASILEQF